MKWDLTKKIADRVFTGAECIPRNAPRTAPKYNYQYFIDNCKTDILTINYTKDYVHLYIMKKLNYLKKAFGWPLLALALAGTHHCAAENSDLSGETISEIPFAAKINGETLDCGTDFSSPGKTGNEADSLRLLDFRFYVHDIRFLDDEGNAVEAALAQDNLYQSAGLALLDFEDATGDCAGTEELNTTVKLSAPVNITKYPRLEFKLGVPYELNHQNVDSAEAPLNLSPMYWNWRFGYKFMKIEFNFSHQASGIENQIFQFHLGSTDCPGTTPPTENTGECSNPNVPAIQLGEFTANSVVALDLGNLLKDVYLDRYDTNGVTSGEVPDGSAVSTNKSGCMSARLDYECAPVFNALGLDFTPVGNNELYGLTDGQASVSEGQSAFSLTEGE